MECNCYYCSKYRELSKATRERDVETLTGLVEQLGGRAISAEFDRDYYEAVLDGDWPSSVEILEKALARAKALKDKNGKEEQKKKTD